MGEYYSPCYCISDDCNKCQALTIDDFPGTSLRLPMHKFQDVNDVLKDVKPSNTDEMLEQIGGYQETFGGETTEKSETNYHVKKSRCNCNISYCFYAIALVFIGLLVVFSIYFLSK